MVSTAFFKGIIMNRQFRCGLTEPHFSFDSAKTLIFSSESSLFRRILPLFFVQCSCVLRVFHRGISLFSAELPLY